jgi:hypothetical protein
MSDSPLFLPAHLLPDMSEGDRAIEVSLMIDRQIAIYDAINGDLPASQLLELIDSQEIPIDDWISDLQDFGFA